MESPKKLSDLFGVEATLASLEAQARADGFDSLDASLAHDEARRAEIAAREDEAVLRGRREIYRGKLCDTLVGRMPDDVLAVLRGDAEVVFPRPDVPVPVKAWRAVRAWLASRTHPVLILAGGVGVGKTIAAVRAMVESGERAQFVRTVQVGYQHERWASDPELQLPALDLTCGFLVVDDLGLESKTDSRAVRALEEIADARQSLSRRTIFTTNLSREEYEERYSERIKSRLRSTAKLIRIDDVDHRRAR